MGREIGPGDLLAVYGRGWRRWFGIRHVMIVAPVFGKMVVFEFTARPRPVCVRTGRENPIGLQAHYLDDFLSGSFGRLRHYPLVRPLYLHEEDRMIDPVVADLCGHAPEAWESRHPLLHRLGLANCYYAADYVLHVWRQIGIFQVRRRLSTPRQLIRRGIAAGIIESGPWIA